MATKSKKKNTIKFKYALYVLLSLLVVVIGLVIYHFVSLYIDQNHREKMGLSYYYAVFLTNNQTYFGKIKGESGDYILLDDVHYLQAEKKDELSQSSVNSSDIVVIPLGSEIHGPSNQMKINKDHVLFLEVLKKDSQVVKSILSKN
jgi:hypothetical protein